MNDSSSARRGEGVWDRLPSRLSALACMRPGLWLMRRLRMSSKLALMAMLAVMPMLFVLLDTLQGKMHELSVVRSEQAGVAVALPLSALVNEVHLLRALTEHVIAGDTASVQPREDAVKRVEQAVAAVDQGVRAHPSLSLDERWRAKRSLVLALSTQVLPSEGMRAYDTALQFVQQIMQLNAERSLLLFDPQPASYFLMDLGVNKTAAWQESLADVYVDGSRALLRTVEPATKLRLTLRIDGVERQLGTVRDVIDALARTGEAVPHHWDQAARQTKAYAEAGREMFGEVEVPRHASLLLAKGIKAATSVNELNQEIFQRLDELLAQRAKAHLEAIFKGLVVCGLGGVLSAYLAACFFVSFTDSLGKVLHNMSAITGGDLSRNMVIEGKDELSGIGKEMEQMVHKLSSLVAEIRTSAVQVGQAGQKVASEGVSFAQQTEGQAQHLRASVTAVTSLSEAVSANAHSASALSDLTTDLCQRVQGGAQTMDDTVASMNMLEQSTSRVAEINSVIEDLAFQTNILALNAAVEAARAGDAGKGFGVVASEVRQLAVRCSEAAAEIQALVGQTTERVEITKSSLHDVSVTLQDIFSGIGTVSVRLKDIAASNLTQSESLKLVIEDVHSANAMTRESVGWVERSTDASKGLLAQATSLRQSVLGIQLRQGSADESRELVERAVQHVHEVGWDTAAKDFVDPRGRWIDRDLYLFVFDRDGRYVLHGNRADFVGQLMQDAIGAAGEDFIRAARVALEGEPVWVDFIFPSRRTGEPVPKTAFVAPLTPNWLIAAAVYRNAGEVALAQDAVAAAG